MARTAHDTLTIDIDIPDVRASQLRQYIGMLIESALPGMQPHYSVAITADNRLRVEVRGLNVAIRAYFSRCQPPDPDNMTSGEDEELSPPEANNRIFKKFKEAKLNPKQVR